MEPRQRHATADSEILDKLLDIVTLSCAEPVL